jgi:hypothetical protein
MASAQRRSKAEATTAQVPRGSVRIRHYCQGIGDCHLLRFARAEGGDFTMLIDCGVHPSVKGGADRMRAIVEDIAEATGGRIDVLVVTHEHMDHVSGFLSAAERFTELDVGEVWFGWTENPDDAQAAELDKFKATGAAALTLAGSRLTAAPPDAELAGFRAGLDAMMGFYFGAKGERVRSARDAARNLARGKVVYHEPGAGPFALPGVEGVRVYVLGPPRDVRQLRVDDRASETYGSAFGFGPVTIRSLMTALGGVGDDWDAPFDPEIGLELAEVLPLAEDPKGKVGARERDAADRRATVELLRDSYAGPGPGKDPAIADQRWRRIDVDHFAMSAELALQLDRMTNNCSLVLAFELDTGRVLLFAGDAQVGSWISWQDLEWTACGERVTGPDLLARTVYLKVAHHGSHNATLKVKGLELMTEPDLSAFVPVNAEDAAKVGWHEMPFDEILHELGRRTSSRVIRADDPWIARGQIPNEFTARGGSLTVVGVGEEGLWIELDVA